MHIYNNNKFKELRQKLRQTVTPGERKLWGKLRNKQFLGIKFFRQYGIGPYVSDFYCPEFRIAIEINGSSHDESKFDYDRKRQKFIESLDITVFNFSEFEAVNRLQNIIDTLELFLGDK